MAQPTAAATAPAIAFYYAADPPWDALQAFDAVVVDPDHVAAPDQLPLTRTRLFAYVSVGEVQPGRSYAKQITPAWLVGDNPEWGSRLIDQSAPGWPAFFAEQVVGPLWRAGYRGFFLDTLDSYQRFSVTAEACARQEAGLVEVVRLLKRRYPEANLIFNRGFEILDRTHDLAYAVAAESLYQGYDAGARRFRPVAEPDRAWLLGQLGKVRDEYRLPVIAIDYLPPDRREEARAVARQIIAQGFIPWVATPDLGMIGVGAVEVEPRRILLVHSPLADEYELRQRAVVRFATMPLNYLGYAAEYVDRRHLPTRTLAGRYAGVVVWLSDGDSGEELRDLAGWLGKQQEEGVPFAVVSQTAVLREPRLARRLGLDFGKTPSPGAVHIVERAASVGFEREPYPQASEFFALAPAGGRSLLTVAMSGARQAAAAITPWGGYIMFPYAVATLPTGDESRWVIDPFAFFTEALRLPTMPVPDTTTMSGRRLFMVHMDGDGFVSRSELPGNPFAGELVRDRVVRRYALPMTLSVIEAELSPRGLYPGFSARLEGVARDIFAARHVEIASHSYSHPFNWRKAQTSDDSNEDYTLAVPGYHFDLNREIAGSVAYINERLAPAGKRVSMFLWTGDCIPGRDALEAADRLGVANMNGGDTVATRSTATLTRVEGLGLARNGRFQTFAPNQNENVYTNRWTGPFDGYRRVIETFEFTERPRRLKPIDIYFHTYLTTKRAGMQALDDVFAYALSQETTPVFASEFAAQVGDFTSLAVAREGDGWRIRGAASLRTLRLPASLGVPDLAASRGVAGYRQLGDQTYVHLAADDARLVLAQSGAPRHVRLESANARIETFEPTERGARWTLAGHVPLDITLADATGCRLTAGGKPVTARRSDGERLRIHLNDHAARPLEAICQR
jgi:hypothetical protein